MIWLEAAGVVGAGAGMAVTAYAVRRAEADAVRALVRRHRPDPVRSVRAAYDGLPYRGRMRDVLEPVEWS